MIRYSPKQTTSPAASKQSTATAVPTAGLTPGAESPSGPSTRGPERLDRPTSANATSTTTVSAAAAATTATSANDAQSMCTDASQESGHEVRDRWPRDVVDVGRGDRGATGYAVDPRGHGRSAHGDDDHAGGAGRGQPRGGRTHDPRGRQGEGPGERDPAGDPPVHRRKPATGRRSEDRPGAHLRGGQRQPQVGGGQDHGRAGGLGAE